MKRWLFKINIVNLILLTVCVGINVLGSIIATETKAPFLLAGIGTMFVAINLGPVAGSLVGVISGLIYGMGFSHIENLAILYAITGILTGVIVGTYLSDEDKLKPYRVVAVALLTGVMTTVVTVPYDLYFREGYTGNEWGDALYELITTKSSINVFNTVLAQGFIELPDKVVCMLLAAIILMITRKVTIKKDTAKKVTTTAIILMCFAFCGKINAEAVDFEADYETVRYDTEDGLVSSEINAVAQTNDGFFWAGTYSGLYRYDGSSFEEMILDDGINNVMSLFVDSKGRLWIGTNDSGLVCYDYEDDKLTYYCMEDGLAADSIRSIEEDENGNIYVGTVSYISIIDASGNVKTYGEWANEIYAQSLVNAGDGKMMGVTNAGTLFCIKDKELIWEKEYDGEEGVYYTHMEISGSGDVLVGTSSNIIQKFKLNGDDIELESDLSIGDNSYVNRILYNSEIGGFLYCCENGMGFINENTYTDVQMEKDGFDSSVSDVVVDEQLNVWFASNKQSIIKFSWNPFENVFKKAGLPSSIVNSVVLKDNLMFVGKDDGLVVIDKDTYSVVDYPVTEMFDGVRIRNVMADSSGNIWLSTYGQDGLVKIDEDGNTTSFNEANAGTLGGRFRFSKELSDGQILAATNMGLTFIKDDTVVNSLGEKEGLNTSTILCAYEKEDGTILAGSDGDGIYVIKDGNVINHIAADDGLNTLVVLKIVKCSDGYLYVTSNAIYHDDGKSINKLNLFPYSNNYDVYINDEKMCFITSSAGLYVVSEKELLGNNNYNATLLNKSRGFATTLTANSWNAVDGDTLFLCCTDGIRGISTTKYNSFDEDYQIGISSIKAGDLPVVEEEGKYVIPAITGRIQIKVAILNYSLSNPLIHVYLEGLEDDGITAYQNDLTDLGYTNLSSGKYKLHVQILSESDESVEREEVFEIKKEALMYETLYFKIYLLTICGLLILFLVWSVIYLHENSKRLKGLQKEVSIDPMTGLFNKAASSQKLEEICKKEKGVLLMIDLDSFKLVNDIYGHDMGDKILIRFAELIKESIKQNDLAGRMGGDEFIAFLKGDVSEDEVIDMTAFLNREIVKSAKEFMGEDMEIPLGTSIGAVFCAGEGDEYSELFRLADNALYLVKNNGKHGCDFYRKNSVQDESEVIKDNETIEALMKILGERNEHSGAYVLKPEEMQTVYRFLCRYTKRYPANIEFARLRIFSNKDDEAVPENIIKEIGEMLAKAMRGCDILSRNGSQYLLLYTVAQHKDRAVLINRMLTEWQECPESGDYEIKYEIQLINEGGN